MSVLSRSLATAALFLGALFLGGCAHLPAERGLGCPIAAPQRPAGNATSARLSVLTYNVEGLPWPARKGRKPFLRMIGDVLRQMNSDPNGPDVVLLQEVFSPTAAKSISTGTYPSLVSGPSRTMRSLFKREGRLPGRSKPLKGEIGLRFMTSGLVILSRYPILETVSQPYARRSCAGIDCLSNKGVLLARVAVPGVPAPVDLFTTHMNSQAASRVSPQRHLAAHNRQTHELRSFVADQWNRHNPAILGGDFNMRGAPGRFEPFEEIRPFELVHLYCLERPGACDVRMSWDDDEPWMDTQDLQLFAPGSGISIRPVTLEAVFDGRPGSPLLSDHDGFLVTYRLSWAADTVKTAPCAMSRSATVNPKER